jgi:VIT1/CCC1 family predicted Fe2+/Mn2+ transporter
VVAAPRDAAGVSGPLESWRDEKQSAFLYHALAAAERGSPRQALFEDLARAAERQAEIWAESARKKGQEPPAFAPDRRARIAAALIRRFEPRRIRPMLAAMKVRGLSVYAGKAPGHEMPVSVEQVGARHRGTGSGGNLRAAVFGVNDGLVSNASLILGVAGASSDGGVILLSGVAGLLAGAFSMAAGEYVSVRSQRELLESQIALERDELGEYPEEEATELALIYAARGIPEPDAHRLAQRIVADPTRALDTLAREELGLNPDELGSPFGAALFSFVSFSAGALVPLAPFLFATGSAALALAIALAALALVAVGTALSLFTGRSAAWGGLRMLLIGGAAGAATWGIGRLLGVTLA